MTILERAGLVLNTRGSYKTTERLDKILKLSKSHRGTVIGVYVQMANKLSNTGDYARIGEKEIEKLDEIFSVALDVKPTRSRSHSTETFGFMTLPVFESSGLSDGELMSMVAKAQGVIDALPEGKTDE